MDLFEKETIINFNEGEQEAEIYSCTSSIWTKCVKAGLKLKKTTTINDKIISKTYTCPKGYIKIKKPHKSNQSPEQREASRKRMIALAEKRKNEKQHIESASS